MAKGQSGQGPGEFEFVRQALDAAALAARLTGPAGRPAAIGFAELYAYATDPAHVPRAELLLVLDEDERLRADFAALLRTTASIRLPQAAAASSGALSAREAEGCRISFRESKADAAQIYVIIELADTSAPAPGSLFVCGADQTVRKIALPEAQDGRIQLLLEADSDLVQGLRDIDTEVFLR